MKTWQQGRTKKRKKKMLNVFSKHATMPGACASMTFGVSLVTRLL